MAYTATVYVYGLRYGLQLLIRVNQHVRITLTVFFVVILLEYEKKSE